MNRSVLGVSFLAVALVLYWAHSYLYFQWACRFLGNIDGSGSSTQLCDGATITAKQYTLQKNLIPTTHILHVQNIALYVPGLDASTTIEQKQSFSRVTTGRLSITVTTYASELPKYHFMNIVQVKPKDLLGFGNTSRTLNNLISKMNMLSTDDEYVYAFCDKKCGWFSKNGETFKMHFGDDSQTATIIRAKNYTQPDIDKLVALILSNEQ